MANGIFWLNFIYFLIDFDDLLKYLPMKKKRKKIPMNLERFYGLKNSLFVFSSHSEKYLNFIIIYNKYIKNNSIFNFFLFS